MTETFTRLRLTSFVILFALTVAVLGLAANFATVFLPHIHEDFVIFALVVPSVSIIFLIMMVSYSQPRTEVIFDAIMAILWLSLAAWSEDIIGGVQCSDIPGDQRTPTANGHTMSARAYCREMKVIEAFSWMLFGLLTIFFVIVIALASRAKHLGRPYAWEESIAELPWFGEYPGYDHYYEGRQYPGMYYPGQQQGGFMVQQGGMMQQQLPGHSMIIQPSQNGGPPTVTQVPGHVQSVV